MIHYIIYRCQKKPNFGRTILYKLLYFSDFNFYELYEKPLSGEIMFINREIQFLKIF